MKLHRITLEQVLIFLALLLAVLLRYYHLDVAALSDFEAERALQALQVSEGSRSDLMPGPAYTLLTGFVFFLFNADNFFARFWPAVAGVCLIGLVIFLKSTMGRLAALILAFGLALDPGLATISRLAGGPMLAVGFGLLALGAVYSRRPILAGVCAALAALSGPEVIHGVTQIVLAVGLGMLISKFGKLAPLSSDRPEMFSKPEIASGLLSGGGVVLVAGTLFFRFPEGLGAWIGIIPAYLNGWVNPSGTPSLQLLAALLIYQPLAAVFAITASVHAWRRQNTFMQWVSVWAISAFVLILLYPGRHVSDLIWLLVPLWILAAWEIASHFRTEDVEWLPAAGLAALLAILLALGWLNLTGLGTLGGDPQTFRLRWVVIGGILILGAVTTILVGLGWSFKTARRGLVWGLLTALGIYMISNLWGVTQLRSNGEQDLWYPTPVIRQAQELLITLGDLSEWNTGLRSSLDVYVTSPEASLKWALREWSNAQFMTSVPPGVMPSVVIGTEDQPEPGLSASYRGQDFAWWISPDWGDVLPADWVKWIVFRNSPQQIRHTILWARSDIFPGGTTDLDTGDLLDDEELIPEISP